MSMFTKIIGGLVPTLGLALGGPIGGAVASRIAKKLGVSSDDEPALIAAASAPGAKEKLLEIEPEIVELEVQFNKGRQKIALTELKSEDKYVRRSRPSFLYGMTVVWIYQGIGLTTAMLIVALKGDVSVIKATTEGIAAMVTAFMPIWGIALTVSGVAIAKRSGDKAVAAGHPPGGVISGIMKKLSG